VNANTHEAGNEETGPIHVTVTVIHSRDHEKIYSKTANRSPCFYQ